MTSPSALVLEIILQTSATHPVFGRKRGSINGVVPNV